MFTEAFPPRGACVGSISHKRKLRFCLLNGARGRHTAPPGSGTRAGPSLSLCLEGMLPCEGQRGLHPRPQGGVACVPAPAGWWPLVCPHCVHHPGSQGCHPSLNSRWVTEAPNASWWPNRCRTSSFKAQGHPRTGQEERGMQKRFSSKLGTSDILSGLQNH